MSSNRILTGTSSATDQPTGSAPRYTAQGLDIILIAKVRLTEPPRSEIPNGTPYVPVGMITSGFVSIKELDPVLHQFRTQLSDPENKATVHAELAALHDRFLHPYTQWQYRNEPWPAQPCPMAVTILYCVLSASQVLERSGGRCQIVEHKNFSQQDRRVRHLKVFCDITDAPHLKFCKSLVTSSANGAPCHHPGSEHNPFAGSQVFAEEFPRLNFHEAITALLDPFYWPRESAGALERRFLRESHPIVASATRKGQHRPSNYIPVPHTADQAFYLELKTLFAKFATGTSPKELGSITWTPEQVQSFMLALQDLSTIPDKLLDWFPILWRPIAQMSMARPFLDLGPFAVTYKQVLRLLRYLPEVRVLSLSNKEWVNEDILYSLQQDVPFINRLIVMDCPNINEAELEKLKEMGELSMLEVIRTNPGLSRALTFSRIPQSHFSFIFRCRETVEGRPEESSFHHGISKAVFRPNAVLQGLFEFLLTIDPSSPLNIRATAALNPSFSQLPDIRGGARYEDLVLIDPTGCHTLYEDLFIPLKELPPKDDYVPRPYGELCAPYRDGNTKDGYIFILDTHIHHAPPPITVRSTFHWGLLKITGGKQQQCSLKEFLEDIVFNDDADARAIYIRQYLPWRALVIQLNTLLHTAFIPMEKPEAESVLAAVDNTFVFKKRSSKARKGHRK